jgi:hypothetical protein
MEELEKAKLIKDALKLVDDLAKMDANDILANDDDAEELETLIDKAKNLKKNRLWKLT